MQLTIYSVEFNPSSCSYDPFCFKFITWLMVMGKLLDLAFHAGNGSWIPYIGLQALIKYKNCALGKNVWAIEWRCVNVSHKDYSI